MTAIINQGKLPILDPKAPDYAAKVAALAAQIESGTAPTIDSEAVRAPRHTGYSQTTFDEGNELSPDATIEGTPISTTNSMGKRVIKFTDDIGDEREFELDLADDKITEFAKRAARTENLEQEMAAMRDEMSGRVKALEAERVKVQRYLDLERAGGREATLNELFKDIGGYEGLRKQIIDEHAQYEKMTAEEKRDYDIKRVQADSARKMAELEKRLSEREKVADAKTANAERAAKIAMLNGVYTKYRYDNANGDPAISKINEMIFNEAQTKIRTLESQNVTITENILNREFKAAHSLFRGKINVGAAPKVDKAKELANQADAAAAAAQTLTSQNSVGGSEGEAQIMQRWLTDIQTGKGLQVVNESKKSPAMQRLYAKFANMLSNNRGSLGIKTAKKSPT